MFKAITSFELKYHLKAPLFYILFIVYFLLTFGAVTTDGVQIGGAVGAVNRNAPYVIMLFMLVMSVFGVLTTTAFVANSVHRDFELGCQRGERRCVVAGELAPNIRDDVARQTVDPLVNVPVRR